MAQHILVRRTGWGAVWLAAAWLSAAVAQAQTPQVVTLDDVVRTTLERSPNVLTSRQDIALRTGQVRETRGAFDWKIHFGAGYEHTDTYISGTWWGQEYKRRTQFLESHAALQTIREQLGAAIARNSMVRPACPAGSTLIIQDASTPGQLPKPICTPVTSDPLAINYGSLDPANFDMGVFFLPTTPTRDPLAALDFVKRYSQINGLSIPDFVEDMRQRGLEELQKAYRLVYEYELRTEYGLWRLGAFPSFEVSNTVRLNGDLTKPLRSGGAFQVSGFIDGVENRFRGKPLDPRFGGKEMQNRFRGRFEASFYQPLFRGRGRAAAMASERAAMVNLESGRATYLHTVAEDVLASVVAYLDVVAGQQKLALLQDSLMAQRRLLDANMRLAAAGDIARADVTRMQARVADVETSLAQARQELVASQATLAQNAGWRVDELIGASRAGDRFPDMPFQVDPGALAQGGVTARQDLRAAENARQSAHILLDAALVNARPKLDLQVRVGLTNAYYSPYFRVLIDEFNRCTTDWADTTAPCYERRDGGAVNYYSLVGVGRAFRQHWEPVASITFTYELPWGNNRALGRVERARSAVGRSDIQMANLARVAQENVTQQAGVLGKARDEWLRRREAVERYQATWADSEKRRAAGDLSLIDTLLTESDLTNARLALVQAQRDHSVALARLRFETGVLVGFRGDQPVPDLTGLVVR